MAAVLSPLLLISSVYKASAVEDLRCSTSSIALEGSMYSQPLVSLIALITSYWSEELDTEYGFEYYLSMSEVF